MSAARLRSGRKCRCSGDRATRAVSGSRWWIWLPAATSTSSLSTASGATITPRLRSSTTSETSTIASRSRLPPRAHPALPPPPPPHRQPPPLAGVEARAALARRVALSPAVPPTRTAWAFAAAEAVRPRMARLCLRGRSSSFTTLPRCCCLPSCGCCCRRTTGTTQPCRSRCRCTTSSAPKGPRWQSFRWRTATRTAPSRSCSTSPSRAPATAARHAAQPKRPSRQPQRQPWRACRAARRSSAGLAALQRRC
mmetsp:Transcript_28017/g.83713  ORF Transcript_28017/g.83713 Transcript_28017/m.83713 type:complete len:252 (-) Transcript_28017:1542-2297(-)